MGLGIEALGNDLVIGGGRRGVVVSVDEDDGGVGVCGEFADFGTVAGAGTGAGDVDGEGSEVEDRDGGGSGRGGRGTFGVHDGWVGGGGGEGW